MQLTFENEKLNEEKNDWEGRADKKTIYQAEDNSEFYWRGEREWKLKRYKKKKNLGECCGIALATCRRYKRFLVFW